MGLHKTFPSSCLRPSPPGGREPGEAGKEWKRNKEQDPSSGAPAATRLLSQWVQAWLTYFACKYKPMIGHDMFNFRQWSEEYELVKQNKLQKGWQKQPHKEQEKVLLAQLQLDKRRLYFTQVNRQHTLPAAPIPLRANIPVCKTMRCISIPFRETSSLLASLFIITLSRAQLPNFCVSISLGLYSIIWYDRIK